MYYKAQGVVPCQCVPIRGPPVTRIRHAIIDTPHGIHSGIGASRRRLGIDASNINIIEISKTVTNDGIDKSTATGSIPRNARAKGPPHGDESASEKSATATIETITARARRCSRCVTVNSNSSHTIQAAGEPTIHNSRVPPGNVLRAQIASATSAATSRSTVQVRGRRNRTLRQAAGRSRKNALTRALTPRRLGGSPSRTIPRRCRSAQSADK